MSYTRTRKRRLSRRPRPLRRAILLLIGVIALICVALLVRSNFPSNEALEKTTNQNSVSHRSPSIVPTRTQTQPVSASIFVPYWTVDSYTGSGDLPANINHSKTAYALYFGVAPTTSGLDTSEPGYARISTFISNSASFSGKKLLTVRMLNEDITTHYLEDTQAQNNLISEILDLTANHGFDGIVLDLEHSVLPTENTINHITAFVRHFSEKTRSQNKEFTMTVFGDTFYRQRPYDIRALEQSVDQFFIMAYDFHKSYGEPGPNFPLNHGNVYGYDFDTMMQAYIELVPAQKLTVLFGFFGYNWAVDDENRPAASAKALTLNQIRSQFYPQCTFKNCIVTRDPISAETRITYEEENGQKHVVWFEDETSIKQKIGLLHDYGVLSVGYWAFGYY